MNTMLFKVQMVKHHDTQIKLAEDMSMAPSAINARINGRIDFRQNEINFIRKRYGLSDRETVDIFFEEEVSKKDTDEKGA